MQIVEFKSGRAPVKGYIQDDYDTLVHHKLRPAMIVCPGGGYTFTCPREADPAAFEFLAMGFNVFILDYSVLEYAADFRPLLELAETVSTVRERSAEWHIDPTKVAVMGFSAAGHLAASLGTLWNDPQLSLPESSRPDALVLCYPVITLGEYTHRSTCDYVTAGDAAMREKLSVEKHVHPSMPPVFVWHTMDDGSVPVENTLMLINELRKNGVDFECHIFAHGQHGISVCTQEVETPNARCREWVKLCKAWLCDRFAFEP